MANQNDEATKAAAEKAAAEKAAKKKDHAVEPVLALHRITYGTDANGRGLGKVAEAQSMFRPTSQEEADELAALEATRPLDKIETGIFAQIESDAAGADVIG